MNIADALFGKAEILPNPPEYIVYKGCLYKRKSRDIETIVDIETAKKYQSQIFGNYGN